MPAESDSDNTDENKEEKEAVKKNILAILKEKYGIEEEDFLSAELEAVPAGPARDYGLDRSMIMGYGHDDRDVLIRRLLHFLIHHRLQELVCAYL